MRALLDTNILIDYLAGVEAAREEIARHDGPLISTITWMEVLVGASDEGRWRVSGGSCPVSGASPSTTA